MSMSASGSLAKTLTYAHWKGRPYVRQLVTPANPQSTAQVYTRAMMRYLSQQWGSFDPTLKAQYNDLAKQGNFSPFNAWVRLMMMRWTQGLTPYENYPQEPGGPNPTLGTLTPTGGVGQITGTIVITTIAAGMGIIYSAALHNAGTAPLSAARLINTLDGVADGDTVNFSITGLDPGTYDLSVRAFNVDGDAPTAATSHASLVVS